MAAFAGRGAPCVHAFPARTDRVRRARAAHDESAAGCALGAARHAGGRGPAQCHAQSAGACARVRLKNSRNAMPADQWTPSLRYPDPSVTALDSRFNKYRLPLASVERLYTGTRWSEGPVWFGDARCLLWSDVPGDCMYRWDEE